MDEMDSSSSDTMEKALDMVHVVARLSSLVEEQNALFRDLSHRWSPAHHPATSVTNLSRVVPQSVPSRSISAWKPLLSSFNNGNRPLLDRWRRNLDTTLIFIGLFSAIITAFFVESLNEMKPSDTFQTNALLANLTDILILLSRNSSADLSILSEAAPFEPDPNEVRFSFYCALALILSISTAAIAVAGHAFLSALVHTHGDSVTQLTEQYQRWLSARSFLAPPIETVPQLLALPVLVFILGLLDKLFSSSLHLPVIPKTLLASAIISGVLVAVMGVSMVVALCHGLMYPETSPFQSTILIYLKVKLSNMLNHRRHPRGSPGSSTGTDLSLKSCEVFHRVIQETHDDQSLENASGAVSNIMVASFKLRSSFLNFSPLPALELQTLLHLLSPDASIQSNLSAAMIICDSGVLYYYWDSTHHRVGVDPSQRAALLSALVRAATHATVGPNYSLEWHWRSPFTRALSFLVHYPESQDAWSEPLLGLLCANAFSDPPPPVLVDAHKNTSLYAMKLLTSRLKYVLKPNHADLLRLPSKIIDEAFLRLLGSPELDRHQLIALIKSMIHTPNRTKEVFLRFTHKEESYTDDALVLSGLARWLSRDSKTIIAASKIVHDSPSSFFSLHSFQTQNMMIILLNILKPNCLSSLNVSSRFLSKACSSPHPWEKYNEGLAVGIISRFLRLFTETMDRWQEDQVARENHCETFGKVRKWVDENVALLDVWTIHADWLDPGDETIQAQIDEANMMLNDKLRLVGHA